MLIVKLPCRDSLMLRSMSPSKLVDVGAAAAAVELEVLAAASSNLVVTLACRFLLQQQLRGTASAEGLAEELKPPQTGDFSVKVRLHL